MLYSRLMNIQDFTKSLASFPDKLTKTVKSAPTKVSQKIANSSGDAVKLSSKVSRAAQEAVQKMRDQSNGLKDMAVKNGNFARSASADPNTVQLLVTGAGASNFYKGHAGIYSPGMGVLSLASDKPYDPRINEMASPEGTLQSFKEYNAHRGVEVYTLKITPQQRAALHKAMVASDATCDEVSENVAYALGRTCAGQDDAVLQQAGILPETLLPVYSTQTLKKRFLEAGGQFDEAQSIPDPRVSATAEPKSWTEISFVR